MLTVSGSAVRATIAAHMLGPASPEWLGAVRLHTHQHDAVSRLRRMMDERGGALLADDVGLGKSYVALALAAGATAAIVIAPAAVREHWLESARRAQVPIALSDYSEPLPDLFVVDFITGRADHPATAHLVIEVAWSSQRLDLDVKAREIRDAYRRAAREAHPARHGESAALRLAASCNNRSSRSACVTSAVCCSTAACAASICLRVGLWVRRLPPMPLRAFSARSRSLISLVE